MASRLLILGGALALIGAGCSDDGDGEGADTQVRVLHLAPVAGAVDVAVDGASAPAISDLGFGEATAYVTLPAGAHDFAVRPAGTSTVALAVSDLVLPADGVHSVVAWGTTSVKGIVVDDSLSGLASGSVRVNVVHAAEGVGQVDIWVLPASGDPSPLVTDFDEGEQQRLDLPAATYRVGLDVDDDATPDLAFSLPALAAGQVVDLFAVVDDDGPRLVAVLPDGTAVAITPDT